MTCVLGSGQAAASPPAWTIQEAPATPALFGVSCPSTSFCSEAGLEVPGVAFHGVSCTSATDCMAVGWSAAGGRPAPLAKRWDGTTWTAQSIPLPSGAMQAWLEGVSCTSATDCVAVGSYEDGSNPDVHGGLIEHWDGATWTRQTFIDPSTDGVTALHGVSCSSASACTAVGTFYAGGRRFTLVERWDGSAWRQQLTTDTPVLGDNRFLGVSCPSSSTCTAVGTVVERWNGTTWNVQQTPSTELAGVSCASTSICTALGGDVVERWTSDGGWRTQSVPLPAPSNEVQFTGVSCPKPNFCTAVGYYWTPGGPTGSQAFVEQYS